MPGSGKHNVNNIDSFFKVRPSRTTIREGETISFLEKGNLVKQEKRNGVVYETVYAEQGAKKETSQSTIVSSGASSSGDITSVTAGAGLTGGGLAGPVTLNIDSTVTTLTGTQTLTNKTLTSPVINTGVSGTAILDENNMASDSDTKLATQQSIKAYVDSEISGIAAPANATITLSPGAGLAAIGDFTTNQSSNETLTIAVDGVLEDLDTLGAASSNGQFIVATGSGAFQYESGSTARTSLGLGTLATLSSISDSQVASDASIAITKLAASSITVADGSSSTAISLGNTITFSGTSNEVTVGESSGTITVGLPDDVVIANSLVVNGTTTTIDTTNLIVEDPLIKLAKANNAADSVDIGFYGLYDTSGTDKYAGLFRDANDSGKFKLFKDLQDEPTTTVDVAGTGYAKATLVADLEGNVTGNVTGNAGTATKLANARDITLTGDITGVTPGAGFDGSAAVTITTSLANDSVDLGTHTTGNYVATLTAGNLIDLQNNSGEGATPTIDVDLSELNTSTSDGDGDFFAVVDSSNAQKKLTKGNINISGFNNDSGFTSNAGTVTSVTVTGGDGLTGGGSAITSSGTVTLSVGSDTLSVGADKVDLSASALTAISEVLGADGFIFFDASATPANSPRLGTVSDLPFTNNAGTITSVSVTAGTGLSGGGSASIGAFSATLDVSGLTVSELAAGSLTTSAEAFADNDTTLMTSAAINDRIESFGYTTNTGDITSVVAGTGLSGGSTSGDATLNLDISGLNTINESQTAAVSDTILVYDYDATEHKQMTLEDLEDVIGGTGTVTNIATENGITGGSITTTGTLGLDFSTLTDMTSDISGTTEFILQNGTVESRKAASEIKLSAFNDDISTTFTTNNFLSGRGTTAIDTTGDSAGLTINYLQSTASGKPTGTDHSLLTMSYSSAWQNQIAQDWRNDGRMFIRGQNNGTWSSWHQVYSDDDTIPIANGGTGATSAAAARQNLDLGDLALLDNASISDVTGLQTALDGKVPTSRTISGVGLTGTGSLASNRTFTVDYLAATDDRDVKPNAITTSGRKQVRAYFSTLGGLTGTANNDYQDLLVLSTYSDGSGGDVNALAFDKSEQKIRHYLADQSATTWGTAKTIAYTDSTMTGTWNGTAINATYVGNLPASKITSGAFDVDRLPTAAVTNGDINNVPTADNVYDFVTGQGYLTSVPNHSASLITSGTLNNARLNTDMQLSSAAPRYKLQETGVTNTPVWWMIADGGNYSIRLNNTGTYPLTITTNGENSAVSSITLGYNTSITGSLETNNRITSTANGGFTIGNYAGRDRIQNSSNSFSFLTDGNGYANMTFGTVTAGTWNGSVIASAYLDADTAHLSGTQTFTGAKTFSAGINVGGLSTGGISGSNYNITGVNAISFSDPGAGEGLTFSNFQIFESPDNLSNAAGNIQFVTGGSSGTRRATIDTSGNLYVQNNITLGGTVDGRNVASDGSKLDGIESGATADQTKADIDALGINATTLDNYDSSRFFRRQGSASATVGPGWMTVATNTSGRQAGEILVTDGDSGDHGFIRIHWLRSYQDSNFTVINCGGHQNRITGVRVLSQDNAGNNEHVYGEKILQVYVEAGSSYDVKIFRMGDDAHYGDHTVHTPTIENTITGYSLHGHQLENLSTYGFAHEEGILAGGNIEADRMRTSTGTAAFPAYSFEADTDTGMLRTQADTIGFATGGSTRFTMSSAGVFYASSAIQAGNAGVQIWDGTHGFKTVLAKDSTYTKLLNNDGNVMIHLGDSGDANSYFQAGEHRFRNLAGSAYYARIGSGYIRGEGGGSVGTPQFSFQNDPNTGMYSLGTDDLGFSAGGVLRYGILNGLNRFYANVVVGPNNNNSKPYIQYKDGYDTASTPSYSWYYDNGCGMGHPAGSTIAFSTASVERLRINNSGLTVTGDMSVNGHLTLQSGHYFTAHNESNYAKYRMYGGSSVYAIGMYSGNTYGGLGDWAMTFTFNDDADRGFLWRHSGMATDEGAMGLTTGGKLNLAHSARIGYGIGDGTTPGATYRLDVSGSIGATADVVAYISSDKRLKDNIKNIANPLEKLEKLNGVEFDWNDKQDLYEGHDIGVIAQEVEEVLPEIVDTREDGHKAVKYDRMVALLIEAVKEQQQQINELKEKLNG